MIGNFVGSAVRGNDFYGRQEFVDLVWEKLSFGHVLLAAPRRFGKTSVMYRLLDAPRWDYRLVQADLEYISEAAEFITILIVSLARHDQLSPVAKALSYFPRALWQGFRRTFTELELHELKIKIREEVAERWQEKGEELFHRLADEQNKTVFILDEFPMMIDNMLEQGRDSEARLLLRWLRALRQAPDNSNVRFLIAGSIGIDHVLSKINETKSINDFERLRLEPFSASVADAFLQELGEGARIHLPEEVRRRMLDLVGTPIPYFLQLLFSQVSTLQRQDKTAVTLEGVEQIYHDVVLGVACKTYFEHYYSRLRYYYHKPTDKAIKRMLRQMAVQAFLTRDVCYQLFFEETGIQSDPDDFDRLMTNLENDFYIRFDPKLGAYSFSCKILRDWWLRHYAR